MFYIKNSIRESISAKQAIMEDDDLIAKIACVAQACIETLNNGNKIILAGNGGSFADAQHIAAEFTSRYMINRDSLPAIALGCNSSSMSAIGNDYGYENIFSRELSSMAQAGDIFIPISTSGRSQNILNAIGIAKNKKLTIFGLAGGDGGLMVTQCECIVVPSFNTGRIQECHMMIGHIICGLTENKLFEGF